MSLRRGALLVALVAALAGCEGDEDAPAPDTLFGAHPAPTPSKLRGVYRTAIEEPGVDIEVRLRFGEGFLVGAVRCTPTAGGAATEAGGKVDLTTTALDAATGKLTVATNLEMKAAGACEATFRAATYDFEVKDATLTLVLQGQARNSALVYTKVGD